MYVYIYELVLIMIAIDIGTLFLEVQRYILAAAEMLLKELQVDGLRVDSTKSIRKFPSGSQAPLDIAI